MRTTAIFSAAVAVACACSTAWAASLPDEIDVQVKNLSPEDSVYDRTRQLLYQSNLWKGQISVFNPSSKQHFNIKVPGVTSTGHGDQQMSGLSLSTHDNAKRLYAVAKNARSFNFGDQSSHGPSSFHAIDLPASADSTPVWSVDFDSVQNKFEQQTGTRPFGIVDSAQDADGNSYVIFALGMPAIAKVTHDGKVSPWFSEKGNGGQRPGYSGIAFDSTTNRLITYGGPRPLTSFNVRASKPTAHPVTLNSSFGTLAGTEKIAAIPVNGKTVMVGARAPYAISFSSNDNWSTASIKKAKRNELANNGFTAVTDYYRGNSQGIYGSGAYFNEGVSGGRTSWPLYQLDSSILHF